MIIMLSMICMIIMIIMLSNEEGILTPYILVSI